MSTVIHFFRVPAYQPPTLLRIIPHKTITGHLSIQPDKRFTRANHIKTKKRSAAAEISHINSSQSFRSVMLRITLGP